MKNSEENRHGILYNLIVLLSVLSGVFLIIFLKLGESKGIVQPVGTKNEEEGRVKSSDKISSKLKSLNSRQLAILSRIEKVGALDPKEIYLMFPAVSSRTLRRDMDFLVDKDQVKQEGATKSTKYIYIGG